MTLYVQIRLRDCSNGLIVSWQNEHHFWCVKWKVISKEGDWRHLSHLSPCQIRSATQSAYWRRSTTTEKSTLISSSPTFGDFAYNVSLRLWVNVALTPNLLYRPWPSSTDGAGLIYTSAKEEKNLDLLYKYTVHKLYDFHFTNPALVVEKDAVFM